MKNFTKNLLCIVLVAVLWNCGGDEEPTVDCNASGLALAVGSTTNAACGSTDGSFTVTASGGDESYMYQIPGGTFVTSNSFTGVGPGTYQVTVKDGNSCEATVEVELSSGVSYANSIQSIIETNCAVSGCHVSGTSRVDLSVFSNIAGNAAGIRSRTASGDMPRGGRSLTQTQIDLIACWVNDGAQNN